jgi:hypothetical protein
VRVARNSEVGALVSVLNGRSVAVGMRVGRRVGIKVGNGVKVGRGVKVGVMVNVGVMVAALGMMV